MKLIPWPWTTTTMALLMGILFYLPGVQGPVEAVFPKQQEQTAALAVDRSDLSTPLWLKVQTVDSELSGAIELNGKLLQSLNPKDNKVNLAPYLHQGRNVVKISGQYYPPHGSVQLELLGPQTQVSQQTSGDGDFQQTLMIEVR